MPFSHFLLYFPSQIGFLYTLEEHKTDIMSKYLDAINFVVSLIIKAVVIPFLSNQSHQPIGRTKYTLPTSCKMSEFFDKFVVE